MKKSAICLSFVFLTLLNLLPGLRLSAQDSTQSTRAASPPPATKDGMVAPTPKEGMIAPVPPFWGEIAAFKKQDSLRRPPEKAILFVGSSSIRKWTNVQADFPGYTIINRGFGGSSFPDVIRYAKDIIYPYHPKQIVIYCGDNDLATSDSVTAEMVFERFLKLYNRIRSHLDTVDILYVSIKPSPSREKLVRKMEDTNDLIRDFLAKHSHAAFIDVYHRMLTPQGHPMDDLFTEDKLHMNAKGYAIWQKVIQPYLDK
jgi:lysophospholipase L1-like esterase